jgi:RNA polymerase sigma-70 factor (ECF subfamily)
VDQTSDLDALLEKVAAGDRDDFAALYRATSPKLFAIALRMLRAADLAEDVLQASYLQIWRKAGRYRRDQGQALAWMATIVRHCAIDVLRSRARELVVEDPKEMSEASLAVDADALWLGIRAGDQLRHCLGQLQDWERRCILLAYYKGMSQGEIAAAVGRPLGSVKSWMRRGLLKLKDCFG